MTRARALVFAVLLSLAGVAMAVDGGGLPSNPSFSTVRATGPDGLTFPPSRSMILLDAGANSSALHWFSATAGTDAKLWDAFNDQSGVLHFRAVNDANSSANDWLSVSRSGTTAQTLALNVNTISSTATTVPWVAQTGSTLGTRVCGASTGNSNTTTTMAVASGMQVTVPAAGGYLLDVFVEFNGTTTGTQGIQWKFGGTSPGGVETGGYGTNGYVNGAAAGTPEYSSLVTARSAAPIDVAVNDWFKMNGIYQSLAAGTFNFQFAQASASANAVNVLTGSYLCLTRFQ